MLSLLDSSSAGHLLEPLQGVAQLGLWVARCEPLLSVEASERLFALLDEQPHASAELPSHLLERVHPEDRAPLVALLQRVVPGLGPFACEFRTVRPDGSIRWLHARAQSALDPSGVRTQVGVLQDLTERRATQDALRMTERRLRTLLESAPEALLVVDVARNRLHDFNDNACALWGRDREAMSRLELSSLAPSTQPDGQSSVLLLRSKLHEALLGARPTFEWTARTAAGELVPTEVRLTRLPDAQRYLVRASVMDISERKRQEATVRQLEERLARAERLQAIGQLAGGIAHDFNNTLSVILALADLVHSSLPKDSPQREDVRTIAQAAQRGAGLTRQLLAFGRKTVLQPRVLDLHEMLRDLERLLRPTLGERVQFQVQTGEGRAMVRVDPEQFERVVVNLVLNARDAVEQGGRIVLGCSVVQLAEPLRGVDGEVPAGRYARVVVRDTGVGMTPEILSRIFEPYYTTKPAGRGTGLGLALVFGIVRQSGGQLVVTSAPGQGSEFAIFLPFTTARPSHASVTSLTESPFDVLTPASALTVLLVEDEPQVRQVGLRVLRRVGYKVLEAEDPESALALSAERREPIDLLVTDMAMPGMDGRELAEKLQVQRPGLRVLYMSGHPRDAEQLEGLHFLAKPFLPRALLQAVQGALGQRVGEAGTDSG